jgi:hypothetical protein
MRTLTSRERRIVRAFIVLLPIFAIAYGARAVVGAHRARSEALAQQRSLLERERAVVADSAALSGPIAEARAAAARAARGVLRGTSRPTTHSALIEHLRTIARRNEVLVVQTSELASDSVADGLTLLRIAVRGESDVAGVSRLLRAIEADPLQLRVSRLSIERVAQDGAAAGIPSDGRQVVIVHATVEALARLDAPRGGGGE